MLSRGTTYISELDFFSFCLFVMVSVFVCWIVMGRQKQSVLTEDEVLEIAQNFAREKGDEIIEPIELVYVSPWSRKEGGHWVIWEDTATRERRIYVEIDDMTGTIRKYFG